jgi:hypothetical protein
MGSITALIEALGLRNDDNIIGFVGELREKKGLAAPLHAYAKS